MHKSWWVLSAGGVPMPHPQDQANLMCCLIMHILTMTILLLSWLPLVCFCQGETKGIWVSVTQKISEYWRPTNTLSLKCIYPLPFSKLLKYFIQLDCCTLPFVIRTKRILARKFAKSKKPLLLWGLYLKQTCESCLLCNKIQLYPIVISGYKEKKNLLQGYPN
jgi:hypothetical protein